MASDAQLHDRVLAALRSVVDPELGLDVVSLGLVYELTVDHGRVEMALGMTAPSCPFATVILSNAEDAIRSVDGVEAVDVRLDLITLWSPDRMSGEARGLLGWQT